MKQTLRIIPAPQARQTARLVILNMLLCIGCTQQQPIITLPDRCGVPLANADGLAVLTVGNVTAEPLEYVDYSVLLDDYLRQQLALKQESPDAKPSDPLVVEPPTYSIDALAKVSYTVHGFIGLEVTFDLIDTDGGQVFNSKMLSPGLRDTADAPLSAADRHELIEQSCMQAVDTFLANHWPRARPIEVAFAAGLSRFDRQGRQLAAEGDYEGALECFGKAIDEIPSDHAALYNAGVTCEAMGSCRRASGLFRRAMRLSENTDYKAAYGRTVAAVQAP